MFKSRDCGIIFQTDVKLFNDHMKSSKVKNLVRNIPKAVECTVEQCLNVPQLHVYK